MNSSGDFSPGFASAAFPRTRLSSSAVITERSFRITGQWRAISGRSTTRCCTYRSFCAFPVRSRGVTVDDLVDLLDVAPTLLHSAGLASYPEFEGRSLLSRNRATIADRDPLLFSRIERFNEKSAVRTERYKLIHTVDTGTNAFGFAIRPGYELYDLQSDPGERLNVYSERPAVARELSERLEHWLGDSTPSGVEELPPFSDEERRMLEDLGYVE